VLCETPLCKGHTHTMASVQRSVLIGGRFVQRCMSNVLAVLRRLHTGELATETKTGALLTLLAHS
jgi:hypothetical protein